MAVEAPEMSGATSTVQPHLTAYSRHHTFWKSVSWHTSLVVWCHSACGLANRGSSSHVKSEAMVLGLKMVDWIRSELLLKVKKFKYLGVLFTSEGKIEGEVNMQISVASALIRASYQTLTYELWVVTKRMSFLWRGAGPTLRDRLCSGCLWVFWASCSGTSQDSPGRAVRRCWGRGTSGLYLI